MGRDAGLCSARSGARGSAQDKRSKPESLPPEDRLREVVIAASPAMDRSSQAGTPRVDWTSDLIDAAAGTSLTKTGSEPGGNLYDVFRQCDTLLVRYIAARVGCRATAEDLRQEVYLRLRRVTRASIENPRGLLFRIATNLVWNHKAQVRRRAELTEEVRHLLAPELDEVSPERRVLADEQLDRAWAALHKLSARTRQVLILSRFNGMKRTDIARELGISCQAVDKHLARAVDCMSAATAAEE
jgi:RNA polymerase sigma factor (sigma-70 family)